MATVESAEKSGDNWNREKSAGLASWFAVWHPRYKGILVQLAVVAALAAGLVFVQQTLLDLLTLSLASGSGSLIGPASDLAKVPGAMSAIAVSLGIGLPFIILAVFILAKVFDAAIDYWESYAGGKLMVRTKTDMEAEILTHLMRKDDTFFARHSPAETVNRLAVDLYRVCSRRTSLLQVFSSVLMIAGSLVFFVFKDWRLALVALTGCLAGALWTRHMTRHVKEMDADYLRQDRPGTHNFFAEIFGKVDSSLLDLSRGALCRSVRCPKSEQNRGLDAFWHGTCGRVRRPLVSGFNGDVAPEDLPIEQLNSDPHRPPTETDCPPMRPAYIGFRLSPISHWRGFCVLVGHVSFPSSFRRTLCLNLAGGAQRNRCSVGGSCSAPSMYSDLQQPVTHANSAIDRHLVKCLH